MTLPHHTRYNFGRGKLWRIWRLGLNSPKFYLQNIYEEELKFTKVYFHQSFSLFTTLTAYLGGCSHSITTAVLCGVLLNTFLCHL